MFKDDVIGLLRRMPHSLPSSVKEAVKAYYTHRQNKFLDKSKNECIDDIAKAVYSSNVITKFTAIAGTFYFNWVDGTRTEHDESNWLDCKRLPDSDDLFDRLANASLER